MFMETLCRLFLRSRPNSFSLTFHRNQTGHLRHQLHAQFIRPGPRSPVPGKKTACLAWATSGVPAASQLPHQLTFIPATHFQAVIVQSGQSGSKDSRKYECGMQYSWYWVVVFLQFVALLIGLAAQFTNKKSRSAAMAMYSTVTALW